MNTLRDIPGGFYWWAALLGLVGHSVLLCEYLAGGALGMGVAAWLSAGVAVLLLMMAVHVEVETEPNCPVQPDRDDYGDLRRSIELEPIADEWR